MRGLLFVSMPLWHGVRALSMRAEGGKTVVLVRHGISKMNVALSKRPWGSPSFVDPNIRDAPLTPEGLAGAEALRALVVREYSHVELVVSSPLGRALQTASAAFDAPLAMTPALALPLAAERLYLSSDVGSSRADLRATPHGRRFDMEHADFASEDWWWTPPGAVLDAATGYAPPPPRNDWRPAGTYICAAEPQAAFEQRMTRLARWIHDRPESTLALVCHWGVISALTGRDFENCQLEEIPVSEIRLRPGAY